VRLHAPRSNALTPRLVSELAAALRDAEASSGLRPRCRSSGPDRHL